MRYVLAAMPCNNPLLPAVLGVNDSANTQSLPQATMTQLCLPLAKEGHRGAMLRRSSPTWPRCMSDCEEEG